MKISTLFDNYIFPALDWMMLDCMRHPCTQLSAVVRDLTGVWFLPSFWQADLIMLLWCTVVFILWRKFAPRPNRTPGTVG